MLTDVFSQRYEDTDLFKVYSRRELRVLHQAFTCLEDLFPYWESVKSERERDANFWNEVHKRISNELGLRWLSDAYYNTTRGLGEYRRTETAKRAEIEICKNWVRASPADNFDVDEFIKDRLSLVEVGMRIALEEIELKRASLKVDDAYVGLLAKSYERRIAKYEEVETELNTRFDRAHYHLNYHNGFIQIQGDHLVSAEIEQPFWSVVSDPLWMNVDIDMKEALDQRDSGGKDPALYAAKALESTIKIISGELGLTHGSEKSAHSFIDNLVKKSTKFISAWEADFMRSYFTNVRNPLGHGPGKEIMPSLGIEETNWAIENAMSWIKLLATRYSSQGQNK